jgi:hypothetical protein
MLVLVQERKTADLLLHRALNGDIHCFYFVVADSVSVIVMASI